MSLKFLPRARLAAWAFSAAATLLLLVTPSAALSADQSYELFFEPKSSYDDGTGVFALGYNSPYRSLRHVVDSDTPDARISFEAVPVIPRAATLHSWSWAAVTDTTTLPAWLDFVAGWAGSPAFALQFNGAASVAAGADPEPVVLKLGGVVHYSHGPERYLEREERVLYLTVHMHVRKSIASRATILADYFVQQPTETAAGAPLYPFQLRSATTPVPSFVAEAGETYSFPCGGSLADLSGACILGTADAADGTQTPMWLGAGAVLSVDTGVLRVRAPLAGWGAIVVQSGATLVLEGGTDTTPFALISEERVPALVNHGQVYVSKGVFQLHGTAMLGFGTVFVAANATMELSPRQEAAFGDAPVSTTNRAVVLDVRGTVNILSGTVHFPRAVIFVGLGKLNVGMAAAAMLSGPTRHVLGGLQTGAGNIASTGGVNAVAAVVSGALTVQSSAALLVGGGLRLQGLGALTVLEDAIVTVDVAWADPVLLPSTGIVATGPAAERPAPGVTVRGGRLLLIKGGLTAATGITVDGTNGSLEVDTDGFLHLSAAGASNVLGGAGTVSRGDVTLLAGASVDFAAPITSTTHVRALDAASVISFSSPVLSVLSRPPGTRVASGLSSGGTTAGVTGLATNPTHLFGLFTPGTLLLRDGARVRLLALNPSAADASLLERARFFAAALYNAGTLELTESAELETGAALQTFEPRSLAISSSAAADFTDGQIDAKTGASSYWAPSLAPRSPLAVLRVVPEDRYQYQATGDAAGTIAQTLTQADFTPAPITIARGALAGARAGYAATPVVVGPRAWASPGAEEPVAALARLDREGRIVGGAWVAAAAAQSVGILRAQALTLSAGSALKVDVVGAGPAGVGYDQVVVDEDMVIASGVALNLTTTFEAFVRQAASVTTLRAVESRRFATLSDAELPAGVVAGGAVRTRAAEAATVESAAEVRQWIATVAVSTTSSARSSSSGSLSASSGSGSGATAQETTTVTVRPLASAGVGRPRGAEVLRVPIVLAGSVSGRFDTVNVLWRLASGSQSGSSSTPADSVYVVQNAVTDMTERFQARINALASTAGSSNTDSSSSSDDSGSATSSGGVTVSTLGASAGERVWDFGLEYSEAAVVLVAWENGAMTSAAAPTSRPASSAIAGVALWAIAAAGAALAAAAWTAMGTERVQGQWRRRRLPAVKAD